MTDRPEEHQPAEDGAEDRAPLVTPPPGADAREGQPAVEEEEGSLQRLAHLVPAPQPVVRAAAAVDEVVLTAADAIKRLVPTPEPVARAATAVEETVGSAVDAATRRWSERAAARIGRLRRSAREPLPYLYDLYPEARRAIPRQLGVRTIDVEEIVGTAVGGATQRGRDFLPLRPFRSQNWAARWQRLRAAMDRLAVLPPIDVVRYGEGYWVLDGHNRVAAALYAGQVDIDANVTELVPSGGTSSERPGSLASIVIGSRAVRAAGAGHPVGPVLEDEPGRPIAPATSEDET
jgi:hypothetical protein